MGCYPRGKGVGMFLWYCYLLRSSERTVSGWWGLMRRPGAAQLAINGRSAGGLSVKCSYTINLVTPRYPRGRWPLKRIQAGARVARSGP
jgi:hypothetical protein